MALDLLDSRIMYELDLNARVSASALAKKFSKSKETIAFRIRRLLQNKFIKGYYAVFNTSKLGFYYYKLYLKLNATPEEEAEVIEYFKQNPKTAYLGSVSGYYDCILLLMVKSAEEMYGLMTQFMENHGHLVNEKYIHTVLTTRRLNQKFFYQEQTIDLHYPYSLGSYELHQVDGKILKLISGNARMPLLEISKKSGIDCKTIAYRLRKLKKDKIVLGYVTAPNFDKLGLEFIQINISLINQAIRHKVIEYFDNTNSCLFALELLGKYDLTIEIHVKSGRELKSIIDGFREEFKKQYVDFDISTMTKEHVMIFCPF